MTETTCVVRSEFQLVICGFPDRIMQISLSPLGYHNSASTGPLIPNLQARLTEEGELLLKGPNIFSQYHNNPSADKETFTNDGWMKTGDICKIDENGHIYVVDRLKEVCLSDLSLSTLSHCIPVDQSKGDAGGTGRLHITVKHLELESDNIHRPVSKLSPSRTSVMD